MNARNLASIVALAGGFAQGRKRAADEDAARLDSEENRRMRKQEFDARMDEANQAKQLRLSLADAAKPVSAETILMKPDSMDNRDVGLPENASEPNGGLALSGYKVGGKSFGNNQSAANAEVANQNAPDAIAARQVNAYRSHGAPEKALTLENAALTQKRANEQFTQGQKDKLAQYEKEGVFKAAQAFRSGDASGLVKTFNAGGDYKLDGEPVITKEDRDVPGIGKIPTYNAKVKIVGPDGKVQERSFNSHDVSMQLFPYEKQLEMMRKGTDSDNKASHQSAMLEAKVKQLELAGQVAEARALKAAAGGGAIGREERLRYTSLFGDAGRRMGESQRALSSLQKDQLFMMNAKKPGTPEASQLTELQDSIKTYGEERSLYQGLLAGSQTPGKQPSLADAEPKAKPATSPTGKPSYSNLWK